MASEISSALVTNILNWIKGVAMPAPPAAIYMALHTGDCGPDGTGGTDVTTTIRTAGRVAVTFGAIAARSMNNSAVVDFGEAVNVSDVTVNSGSLWTAQTGGVCVGASLLPAPLVVSTGLPVKVPVGSAVFGFPIA